MESWRTAHKSYKYIQAIGKGTLLSRAEYKQSLEES